MEEIPLRFLKRRKGREAATPPMGEVERLHLPIDDTTPHAGDRSGRVRILHQTDVVRVFDGRHTLSFRRIKPDGQAMMIDEANPELGAVDVTIEGAPDEDNGFSYPSP